MSKSFFIDTLGCAKNDYDSEVLANGLIAAGFSHVDSPFDADIIIVNTCGFIESAMIESIDHIFSMAEIKGEKKKLVVTGCLSERYHEELIAELPEVDIFVGVNDYSSLPAFLLDDESRGDMVRTSGEDDLAYRERYALAETYSSVLKIAEGCDNNCTFCVIPKIRGRFRSKAREDVIAEAMELARKGTKELILIAQDTSSYGLDLYGKRTLAELLYDLNEIEGIEWIRLMYVYDNGIDDELIEAIKACDKVCNYIDMPIQHISDHVLKLMGRKSTKESITNVISKLRREIPDIHIRTTLLVGTPGETDEDHKELLSFVKSTMIDRLGVFVFSEEEGTAAEKMKDKVPKAVAEKRKEEIMKVQLEISSELNSSKIGKTFEVIVDECIDEGLEDEAGKNAAALYVGRTRYDSPEIDNSVEWHTSIARKSGDIVNLRIKDSYEYDLIGEEV